MVKEGLLAIVLSLLFLTSCTTVHIYNADGSVDVSHHFGLVFVKVQPGDRTMIIDTKALGIAKAIDAFTIGYLDETVVFADDDCRLIIFEPDANQIENVREMFEDQDSVCIFDETRRGK